MKRSHAKSSSVSLPVKIDPAWVQSNAAIPVVQSAWAIMSSLTNIRLDQRKNILTSLVDKQHVTCEFNKVVDQTKDPPLKSQDCTCKQVPWCSHVVATLLKVANEPDVVQPLTVKEKLNQLSSEQKEKLLEQLVISFPDTAEELLSGSTPKRRKTEQIPVVVELEDNPQPKSIFEQALADLKHATEEFADSCEYPESCAKLEKQCAYMITSGYCQCGAEKLKKNAEPDYGCVIRAIENILEKILGISKDNPTGCLVCFLKLFEFFSNEGEQNYFDETFTNIFDEETDIMIVAWLSVFEKTTLTAEDKKHWLDTLTKFNNSTLNPIIKHLGGDPIQKPIQFITFILG